MSAFMHDVEHVKVLVWAALAVRRHAGESELYWHVDGVEPAVDDRKGLEVIGWSGGPQRVVRKVTRDSADFIGQLLVDENARSVTYRYEEDSLADNRYGFEYGRGPRDTYWTDREVLLALRSYRYQSCEHPEWEESEANRFVHALQERLISRWLRDVPTSAWSISDGSKSEAGAHAEEVRRLAR